MKKVMNKIKKDYTYLKFFFLIIGSFIAALIYNIIFVPNDIIIGGVTGLAIVVKYLFNIDTTLFIDISNLLLIILSLIIFGKKTAFSNICGILVFTIMINLTAPIATYINIDINPYTLKLFIFSIIYGFSAGLIYKAGFATGSFDVITSLTSKIIKKPSALISTIINSIIITMQVFVFDKVQIFYSIFVLYISNKIAHYIVYGISTYKMVYIVSKESKDIEKYLMEKIHSGATEIDITSGFLQRNRKLLLCVVANTKYKNFIKTILKYDKKAFILTNNCYEVSGGIRGNILPF